LLDAGYVEALAGGRGGRGKSTSSWKQNLP
jgi:hypothetical protein